MKYIFSSLVFLLAFTTACNKDKFTTIPQVKVQSISPDEVHFGDILSVKGSYTDQEGDVDSILIVYKWYNGSTAIPRDTFRYSIQELEVPGNPRQADLEINFEYHTNNTNLRFLSSVARDTTATFGLVVKDKEGNRSEYAESDPIRLTNN